MNKQISALIRSLEALDHLMLFTSLKPGFDGRVVDEAYKAINKALASEAIEQPAQRKPLTDEVRCPECGYLTKHTEHIGCLRKQLNAINDFEQRNFAIVNMDKFSPAQRKPLTDEEIDALREKHSEGRGAGWRFDFKGFARAIEAKLKKNT